MALRLPKINHLIAIKSVAYYGSINAASKAMHIPQPTLSRTIKELEEILNVPLVIRGQQGSVLSESGITFVEHASSIVSQLELAVHEARMHSGRGTHKLSFGVSPISVNSVMPPAIDRVLKVFRRCEISVEDNPLEISTKRVREGSLDFAVGNRDADVSLADLVSEPLMDCPFAVACRRGHPLEHSTRLEQLQNANWWITGEFKVCRKKRSDFQSLLINQSLHTRSHIVGLPLVFDYSFIALLSSVQIKRYRALLSIIPIKDLHVIGHYSLIYRKNVPLSPICARMIEYLHHEAEVFPWYDFGEP